MKPKLCLKSLLLLTVYCLSNLQSTWANQALQTRQWTSLNQCYVEKSKVDILLNQINDTLQIFNPGDQFLRRNKNFPAIEVPFNLLGHCTAERIAKIQKDLKEVAGKLMAMAITVDQSQLPVERLQNWHKRKLKLIHDLQAVHVYYDSSIVLYPFLPLVQQLGDILDTALTVESTFPPLLTETTPVSETTFVPNINRPQCYTREITTSETERNRISSLMKRQTAFLLNALESEMRLYAKAIPNLRLVSRASKETASESRVAPSSFNSPLCNFNGTIFNYWRNAFGRSIKKIHLPSEAAACVAILKVAHSAVSSLQSRAETLPFWHEDCEKFLKLRELGRKVAILLDEFSTQLTELHKFRWKPLLTAAINLERNVDCLGPSSSDPEPCYPQRASSFATLHGFFTFKTDSDKSWYFPVEVEK